MAHVTVDFDLCASSGGCTQVAPEVFEIRTDGYLYVLGGYDTALPGDLIDKVQAAADQCPTGAISISED